MKTEMKTLKRYEAYLRLHGHPDGTIEQYVSYPRRYLADMEVDVSNAGIDSIGEWFGRFDWSPNTRRRAYGSLRLFFAWAKHQGLIASNPMDAMKRVRGPRGLPRPIPDAELRPALARCTFEQSLLLRLAAETGLRRGELAAVHSHDVERHGSGFWLRVEGKGRKTRMVPISASTAAWVTRSPGWLFPSPTRKGAHVIPSVIGKRVRRALGNSGWTTHTLRHRFATVAYAGSNDILAVQAILGHESVATTQIYIKVADERLRVVAEQASLAA